MSGIQLLKIKKGKIILALLIALVLVLSPTMSAQAKTGDSFSTCQNRRTLVTKNIVKNNRYYGYLKVFKCNGHYFSMATNKIGYASSTHSHVTRYADGKGWPAVQVYPELRGKYGSVTYLIQDPNTTHKQCFKAFGSITTTRYGTANTNYSFCS